MLWTTSQAGNNTGAKNRPGNMRWDIVIPKEMKAGHNIQRALVWQIRIGLKLSVQQEIH